MLDTLYWQGTGFSALGGHVRRPSLRFCNVLGVNWPIVSILFAFLILAACYGIATPVFEAPDEPAHYFYVKYVADTGTLPVITGTTTEEPWASVGHQPPLYYCLGTLVTAWVDTSDV